MYICIIYYIGCMLDGRCRTMPRMQPWRHFIPLKPDLSDALERRWAEQSIDVKILKLKLALKESGWTTLNSLSLQVYKMLQSQRIAKVNRLSASPSNAKSFQHRIQELLGPKHTTRRRVGGDPLKLQGLLNEEGPKIRRVLSVLGDLSACGCFWQTSAVLQGTSYRCPRCSTGARGL